MMTRRSVLALLLSIVLVLPAYATGPVEKLTIVEQLVTDAVSSQERHVADAGTFSVALTSATWSLVPGIVVTATIEQSFDNGQTWLHLGGLVAVTDVLPPPPHDTLPAITITYPFAKASRRIRVILTVSAPMLLGAEISAQ